MAFGQSAFSHTAFKSHFVGTGAADYAIPHPETLDGLGTLVTSAIKAAEMELRCPIGNTANVYVDLERTAAVGNDDLVVRPGDSVTVSGAVKKTLSAISTASSQVLEVIAKYR